MSGAKRYPCGEAPMGHLILRLDVTGQPLRWIDWQEAVTLHAQEKIAWHAGDTLFTFRGGTSRLTGRRSTICISSIVAIKGVARTAFGSEQVPPLSNRELFFRDRYLCMYCGHEHPPRMLTRDHVMPLSRGGRNCWSNVVTACRPCNHAKRAHTPEEAGMALLAVPFVPNRAEYLVLSNRRILIDQMEFLRKRFRRGSRLKQWQ